LPLEVATQRNFVADIIRRQLDFIHKNGTFVFEPPFGGVRGNVRTSTVARWNALDDFLFVMIELFSSSYG